MIHRSGSRTQIELSGKRLQNVVLGVLNGFRKRESLGEVGGNGAGQRAAGAVGVRVVDALSVKLYNAFTVAEQIVGV